MNAHAAPRQLLARCIAAAETLSRGAIWVAGSLTLVSALYICADVILRKAMGVSLGGADELSGYAFAISITWALAYATLRRANIRIDVIYQLLPLRIAAILDWIALVGLATFIAYWTRYGIDVFMLSWTRESTANTILGTPLWIPQSLWIVGLIWMCIVLALLLLRSTLALVTGDMATVREVCGMRSAEEEAAQEAEAGRRMAEGN